MKLKIVFFAEISVSIRSSLSLEKGWKKPVNTRMFQICSETCRNDDHWNISHGSKNEANTRERVPFVVFFVSGASG